MIVDLRQKVAELERKCEEQALRSIGQGDILARFTPRFPSKSFLDKNLFIMFFYVLRTARD